MRNIEINEEIYNETCKLSLADEKELLKTYNSIYETVRNDKDNTLKISDFIMKLKNEIKYINGDLKAGLKRISEVNKIDINDLYVIHKHSEYTLSRF